MTKPNTALPRPDEELANLYRSIPRAADGHPDEDAWVRFASNGLDEDQRLALADHAVSCPDCAAILRVVSEVQTGAAGIDPTIGLPAMRSSPSPFKWLALAASVTIAVAGLWMWRSSLPQSLPFNAAIAPSGPSTPVEPPVDTAPPVAAAVVPQWASLGEPPIVRLPTALLTMRGATAEGDAFMTEFGQAIAPYRQGRFADAIDGLEKVARDHPAIVEASFYEGAARLFGDGDAQSAAAAFARAAHSEVVGDEAQWFEAVAMARGGRLTDATRRLETLCSGHSAFRARACEAIARP